ncbi:MAG: aspartate--tRNA ligase [Sulfobacillus sp.]|nr:aspartate--tRNA ligase [Sulfobacillus sp.]
MTGRSHYASEVTEALIGKTVRVAGWVHRRRDHGGLVFVDIRDRTGLVQVVSEPDKPGFAALEQVRSEFVVSVEGVVRARPAGMVNAQIRSGAVEIVPVAVDILSTAQTPPFNLAEANQVDELLRLKYRYLDLRRSELAQNFLLRNRVLMAVRQFFHREGFWDVETPSLARSTPEGARDFLVPSRLQPGLFYALPQSPQIFKQLLMVAGFDRYYQIAKVFRDEDLRADRQPEFTQIDVEMSFMDQEQILSLMEELLRYVFAETLGVTLPPFPRLSWHEAMRLYGSDKPDLRAGPPLVTLTDIAHQLDWALLAEAPSVVGVVIPQYQPSRKELDQWAEEAKDLGVGGLIWIVYGDTLRSSAAKWLKEEGLKGFAEASGLKPGDTLLVVAGEPSVTYPAAGQLRLLAARKTERLDDGWHFLWVTQFPLFEWSQEENRLVSAHHPFTMPMVEDLPQLETDPLSVRSQAYDVVLNGTELASGSLRIYQPELQARIFEILGLSAEEIEQKFGFLLKAFQYGAPPHGGIAFGLDRLLMLMAGAQSIRDVIAFPKTARGTDPLMEAPSPVDPRQLEDVHLRIVH